MAYCLLGGFDVITTPRQEQKLDGLFTECFDYDDSEIREKRLQVLYQDKPLMVQASIAFIVIFLSFLDDEQYHVQGITPKGIRPVKG